MGEVLSGVPSVINWIKYTNFQQPTPELLRLQMELTFKGTPRGTLLFARATFTTGSRVSLALSLYSHLSLLPLLSWLSLLPMNVLLTFSCSM